MSTYVYLRDPFENFKLLSLSDSALSSKHCICVTIEAIEHTLEHQSKFSTYNDHKHKFQWASTNMTNMENFKITINIQCLMYSIEPLQTIR